MKLSHKIVNIAVFFIFSIFLFSHNFNIKAKDLKSQVIKLEESKPKIQLANKYHQNINLQNYLVSEKLDGVRAYYDGEKLISREGNVYNAPDWFIKDFPKEHLEGELWIDRNKFEELSGIVRQKIPNNENWKKVRFMLFDMPKSDKIFAERLELMKNLVKKSQSNYIKVIEQVEITSHEELMRKLNEVIKSGGEGLMLHNYKSLYKSERNDDLLKLKTYEDEEAIVIGYIEGKGRFKGVMGSLVVENQEKVRFKIGTGFSMSERKFPPKIGSVITYKFYGKTKNDKPKFPSFMRISDKI